MEIEKYLKAFFGAAIAGLGALSVAQANDDLVTKSEWIQIAIITLTAFGAVWGVKNADSEE